MSCHQGVPEEDVACSTSSILPVSTQLCPFCTHGPFHSALFVSFNQLVVLPAKKELYLIHLTFTHSPEAASSSLGLIISLSFLSAQPRCWALEGKLLLWVLCKSSHGAKSLLGLRPWWSPWRDEPMSPVHDAWSKRTKTISRDLGRAKGIWIFTVIRGACDICLEEIYTNLTVWN